MGVLMKMNRNRIIRGIARNCPPFLVTGYGSQSSYSLGQIDRAMQETGCDNDYSEYAYVMFGTAEEFPTDSTNSYGDLNGEVGEIFFDGNIDFSAQDFISFSSSGDPSFGGDGCADGGGEGD